MRHLKPRLVVAVLAAATALAVPAGSFAGSPIDPNLNDLLFGVDGGLRYAVDTVPYSSDSGGFASSEAGCGGDHSWRLIGGGAASGGAAAHAWLEYDRPEDYTDADFDPDDGFLGSGYGPTGASLSTYSICAQSTALSYIVKQVPSQPTGVRTGTAMCKPGWHVTSGSVAIASSGSWATSSFPVDGTDAGTIRDNGWRGVGHDSLGGSGGYAVAAICAHGMSLIYRTGTPRVVAPGQPITMNVACYPNVEHVVGGGASVSGSANQSRLVTSRPYDGTDPDGIPDNGWRTTVYDITGGSKTVTSFAICLRS